MPPPPPHGTCPPPQSIPIAQAPPHLAAVPVPGAMPLAAPLATQPPQQPQQLPYHPQQHQYQYLQEPTPPGGGIATHAPAAVQVPVQQPFATFQPMPQPCIASHSLPTSHGGSLQQLPQFQPPPPPLPPSAAAAAPTTPPTMRQNSPTQPQPVFFQQQPPPQPPQQALPPSTRDSYEQHVVPISDPATIVPTGPARDSGEVTGDTSEAIPQPPPPLRVNSTEEGSSGRSEQAPPPEPLN